MFLKTYFVVHELVNSSNYYILRDISEDVLMKLKQMQCKSES